MIDPLLLWCMVIWVTTLDVQAWILGHIHKPEIINSSGPFICYPGSPKPLSPKESGSHHLTLVTCRANQQIEQKAVAPSLLYYQDVTIELSDDLNSDSLRSHCVTEIKNSNPSPFSSKYILAKVILTGRFGDLERINELEQELVGNKFGNCYIHSVENLVEPALNLEELATEKNPAGILAKSLLDIKAEQHNTFIESLRDQLKKTRKNLEHSATFSLLDRLPAEEDDDIPDEDVASDTLIQQAIYRMLYQLHQQKVKSEVYDG